MNLFYNPVSLFIGAASVGKLAEMVLQKEQPVGSVLLLTRGDHVEKAAAVKPLIESFSNREVILKEIRIANPDISDIHSLLTEIRHQSIGLIVAVGGGSVMDMAKAAAALHGDSKKTQAELRSSIEQETYRTRSDFIPWIGIPTTSGTGSEVTCWATIWDRHTGSKYSLSDERLYARYAAIIPELTVTKPLRLSVVTALDALCHAAEAYWSLRTNSISRMYALQAIETIMTYVPKLKADPADLQVRTQLSLASLYAGLAFSNTRTTACHSISYPLTLLHHIEHGIAVSLTLGSLLRINYPTLLEPSKLLHAFGAATTEEVERSILHIYKLYDIPANLSEYGIEMNDIPAIADRAFTKGRMDNNPVALTRQQVQDILVVLL